MPLTVKKQGRETSQNLARRFSQKLRKSGILFEARKRRFHVRPKSKNAIKKSALRRIKKDAEYAQMRKLGTNKQYTR